MNRDSIFPLLNPRTLHLIVLPTEDCNFRCTYCYEDYAIGKMERVTIEAIKKLMHSRISSLDNLALSWFGGEPLIAKNIVTELSFFAKELTHEHNCTFQSDMTTNGFTLNKSTFGKLYDVGIRSFQISLDGPEKEHDQTRKLKSGKGSFEKIWRNLLAMRTHQGAFSVLMRVHIHSKNKESIESFLKQIHEKFGHDLRFNIALKLVGNWGGTSVQTMELANHQSGITYRLHSVLEQLGWYAQRNAVRTDEPVERILPGRQKSATDATVNQPSVITPHEIPQACYAALPNSFVIRADGRLAKCTVAFNDPKNVVGKINEDGTLELSQEKMRGFMRGFQTLSQKELSCPISQMPNIAEEKPLKFFKKS